MRRNMHHTVSAIKQHGFSMLEILITLVIISTALLGTAGLQIYALRMGQDGQFRTQAVFLASDITERMEANKLAAVAGDYVVASASTPSASGSDCAANSCNATALASWDISQWENAIITAGLPQADWQIIQTTAGNPSSYSIIINWADRSASEVPFRYTATRTISN